MTTAERNHEKPLDRALTVLEAFVSAEEPCTVSEIARRVALPTPTIYRLVSLLVQRGLLRREQGSKRLTPGGRLLALGASVLAISMRADQPHVLLRELALQVGEYCQVGVFYEGEALIVEAARGANTNGLSVEYQPGRRVPLHCTSIGKLCLAAMPAGDFEAWLKRYPLKRFTRNTIVYPKTLRATVQAVRDRGWSSTNEEYVLGVNGCAVPLLHKGSFIGGLSVTTPSARVGYDDLRKYVPTLKRASAAIASSLQGT